MTGPALSFMSASARAVAWLSLGDVRQKVLFATDAIEPLLRQHPAALRNRGLVQELVYGVIRRGRTLDTLLSQCVNRPSDQVEPELWELLQLGAYQLLFCERIPVHVAVHETVELARQAGRARWTGFVNGILRGVTRLLAEEPISRADATALPLWNGQWRKLARPAFPDPATHWPEYVAAAFSLPDWLVQRWVPRLSRDELLSLAFACNRTPGLSARVNSLQQTEAQLQAAFSAANRPWTPTDVPGVGLLAEGGSVESLPGFDEGCFTIQDPTAARAALLLAPRAGQRVLDMCAAPGAKTTHLAEIMGDHGTIFACDNQPSRCDRLRENVARLRLKSVEVVELFADGSGLPNGLFDAILVDAPCSNTGVLARRPEARWRISPRDIAELSEVQSRLLNVAISRLAPNGRLVYSTCSLEPEENEQQIAMLTARHPQLVVKSQQLHWPTAQADGGFQALLVREK